MFSSHGKPYTAITQYIERLTGPEYEENDLSGLVDLIEVIRIQDSGPTEAARAIRKKLYEQKYGNTERQLRALTILDALISNAGARFQRSFADEMLLERLRILPSDEMVDIDVRKKCNVLYQQWAVEYKDTRGLESIAKLHKQLPSRVRPAQSQSKVIRETEQEAAQDVASGADSTSSTASVAGSGHRRNVSAANLDVEAPSPRRSPLANVSSPSSSSRTSTPPPSSSGGGIFGHSRKASSNKNTTNSTNKAPTFSLEKEKSNMLSTIANASVASTNLTNALKLINRESQRVSEDSTCKKCFEQCRLLRRQILRYIQLVESDQWIGSLLTANDELIKALMAYEVMDKSVDDDSDSEAESELFNSDGVPIPPRRSSHAGLGQGGGAQQPRKGSLAVGMAGLRVKEENEAPAMPPRRPMVPTGPVPAMPVGKGKKVVEEEEEDEPETPYEDENDPFGDSNAIR